MLDIIYILRITYISYFLSEARRRYRINKHVNAIDNDLLLKNILIDLENNFFISDLLINNYQNIKP